MENCNTYVASFIYINRHVHNDTVTSVYKGNTDEGFHRISERNYCAIY